MLSAPYFADGVLSASEETDEPAVLLWNKETNITR